MSRPVLRLLGAAALAAALLPAPAVRGQDGESSPGPWEEVVFLPESGLSVLLEKDPRGVLLDGSTYLDLHRRAREAGGGGASLPGPAVRLLRVDAEGTVEGDRARVLVRLTLLHRGPGRDVLPIPVGGSVLSATLDGAPATLSSDGKGTPLLAVEGAGFHEAVIEATATVERRQGDRTLVLALPAAPAARWSLTVPGRVTGRAGEGLARTERLSDPDATRFVSYGAAGGIRASWREGDEGTDLPPLLRGRVRILAEVGERAMDVLVLLRLECWRSPADSFPVDLPADLALLGVEGEATLLPEGEAAAGVARHRLRFPEPFTGARAVILRASRALDGPGVAALPVVDLPGAAADRVLAVRFTDGLRGRVEPGAGAIRLDPALSEQGAVDALLRLDAGASALAVSERPSVRLRADARVLLDLADDGPWLAASILYLPRGDRLYGVDPLLPEGFLPETVAVSGDLPFLRGTTPEGRLSLVFPGGVAPGGAVTVTLRGRWPVAGWSAEDAAERTAPLPRFDAGSAVENPSDVEGWLGVSAPAGVDVREEETAGLVPVPVADLRDRAGFTADGLVLGWRFRGSSPGGRVRAVRPEPSVTASVALLVTPLEDHLALLGVVAVRVQRSGIREVRFTVEPSAGDLLRVEGADIAEKRRVAGEGKDTWIVRLGRRVRDGTRLVLRAELPLGKGAAAVPLVSVEGAARRELSVGVAAGGELEVETESRGLRPADPADLAPAMGGAVRGLLRAWKGDGESVPSLRVAVRRLPAEPLPSAFADGITLRTVVGMDSIARTRLVARVRNADRQALEVTLPAGASLHSARVAGEAVRPVRTAAGSLLVPIVPSAEPFDLMLFYEEPLPPGGGTASLRAPDLGIAAAAAGWTVRLPEGALPLSAAGDFASPPERPGVPLCVRILRGIPRIFEGATLGLDRGSPGGAPMKAMPAPATGPEAAMEADEESVPETRAAAPAPVAAPAPEPAAAARIRGRAAKRGLFGMDLRLLEAGPAVTASRLGGTGSLELSWRSASGRAAAALLAGILAFLTALLARRRGVPAPSWTLLALGLFTALPVVLGAVDTAPFDGAAAGTLVYAAGALALFAARKLAGGRLSLAAAAAVAALLLLPASAEAKGGSREGAPAPPVPAPAPDDPVYVLYDPSRPETLRVPERVFLPYEHYRALWNAAHPDRLFSDATAPALVAAAYAGRVEERVLVLEARFEVDPGDGGVLALPPGAAVSDLRVDGLPVAATTAAPGGALLVPLPRGAAGARSVVEATLRWALGGDPPGGVLRVPIPRAPRARLLLVLPLPDPALRLAALGGFTAVPAGESTRVEADLGPLGLLDIAWQPRGADAAGGRTRFEAETEAGAALRPGILEWRAAVAVRVLAGTVTEVEADLPAGLEVQSVSGAPVASWTVTGARVLRVRLLGEGPGDRSFDVVGLIPAPDPAAAAEVPLLSWKGASADRLRVAVSAVDGRVVPVGTEGMERTDAAGTIAAGGLAFRRLRTPARLAVRMEPWPAEITVASRLHLHLGAEESLLRAEMDVAPGPRGMFEGVVLLPSGWTLEDATGADPFPLPGAVRLVFRGSSHEARRVVLRLRGPVPGPDAVPFPLLRLGEGTRETADLLVSTAPGFAAGASAAVGLDAVPADRFASWPALEPGEIRSLAWHDGRGGGSVSVAREALRPTLRPTVVADLTVLDDRVIVDALVHYEIRGGMERVFRVDAPPGVVDPWVLGEGLREVRRETVGGRERLTVTMQAPATGAASFRVLYDLPVPPGGAVTVAGPEPVDGEGARAFLLLRALGDAEVRVGAAPGLDPCDVADLPLVPAGLDPLTVLRFLRARDAAWRLPLTLVAHGMGELPEARIHLVDGTTVADRDGSARTRVAARLFNRSRSFLPVALPEGAELESVLVGSVPVRPVKRAAEPGVVQVPVRVQSLGEESQEVVLTYRTPATTAPGGRFDRLEPRLPSFPGVPVDATTWRLVLPGDRDYSFSGNMDPVEAVEVAIARAEAYASDVARLRQVVQSGTLSQREVAAENLAQNAQEMKDSLDVARSRMAELEQAAADGRVDRSRLDAGRRKAAELARDIEEALGDVRRNAARQEPQADPAYGGPAGEAGKSKQEEAARYATKEGQSYKRWTSNKAPAQEDVDQAGGKAQQRAQRLLDQGVQTAEAAKAPGEADKALAAHERFDASFSEANIDGRLREGWAARGGIDGTVNGVDIPVQGGIAGGRVFLGLVGTLPGAVDDINLQPAGGAGFSFPQSGSGGGGGGGGYQYRGVAGGGGGGGAILLKAVGVVSLSPPLVEQGRSWSFRKLDAGAEITVKARTPGLGRRFGAAAAFLLLAALVFLARRRRAARAARA